ncbi:STAS domain-containing protein [Jannaschia donghaensis]|uniref:Putative anti-sigma factor antagonist n=1 Tax=Jannaschia donghaensis TaxID=420998 RepID=A0A0M6YGR2_9RHOB|nr:STAS domain-containing protein [Jannaschia donghaensis]CTQ49542.1 Putative anti-sigma factor antagonist [Jannaschia donghaensis]
MITSHHPNDGTVVLTVDASRIDAASAMAFKERARQLVQDESGRVLLDLHQVEFLDSSGLGTLVAIMKMLDGGRKLELLNCGGAVRKVLALTRMDSVFIVHPPTDADDRAGQDAA